MKILGGSAAAMVDDQRSPEEELSVPFFEPKTFYPSRCWAAIDRNSAEFCGA